MLEVERVSQRNKEYHELQKTQNGVSKTSRKSSDDNTGGNGGIDRRTKKNPVVVLPSSLSLVERIKVFDRKKVELAEDINTLKASSYAFGKMMNSVSAIKGEIQSFVAQQDVQERVEHKEKILSYINEYNKEKQGVNVFELEVLLRKDEFNENPEALKDNEDDEMLDAEIENQENLQQDTSYLLYSDYDIKHLQNIISSDDGQTLRASLNEELDKLKEHSLYLQTSFSKIRSSLTVLSFNYELSNHDASILKKTLDNVDETFDIKREGANVLALQTKQALALNSLSVASSQDLNVLRLVRS